ncbi:MAG TPA: helix-turn-helix transcriptional regulator [Eubacteriales bacterium]|nr:helix-turn-helix transcriptional regulator [Eubacteriales bacterium]
MPRDADENARTSTLLRQLFQAPDLGTFLDRYQPAARLPDFHEYVLELCRTRQMKKETLIRKAGIERTYGYQLLNGTRKPSRDKVLQLALALRLNADETQKLLQIAGKNPLYPRLKRDAAVLYCISHGHSVMDAQLLLQELGLAPLGEDLQL